jgi:hypothetical protein
VLFAEFRRKLFNALWLRGRDDFTAKEIHCRCDDRAITLMLIKDDLRDCPNPR